jgi:hypothetical protein
VRGVEKQVKEKGKTLIGVREKRKRRRNRKENKSMAKLLQVGTSAQKKRKDSCITTLSEGLYKRTKETHLIK